MVVFVLCWSKLNADSDKACGMKITLLQKKSHPFTCPYNMKSKLKFTRKGAKLAQRIVSIVVKVKSNVIWIRIPTVPNDTVFLWIDARSIHKQHSGTHRFIRSPMAFPFLPAQEIEAQFNFSHQNCPPGPLDDLVNYVETTWINDTYSLEYWSVYGVP